MKRLWPIVLLIVLAALVVFFVAGRANAPTDSLESTTPMTLLDLAAAKGGQPPFTLQTRPYLGGDAVVYKENSSQTTKASVLFVVDGVEYMLDLNEFRLHILPDAGGETYTLVKDKTYYGKVERESVPLPPGAEPRSRSFLVVSDQPFDADGNPVGDPTPRTKSVR